MSEVHDDPLMREGRENLMTLLICIVHNSPHVLYGKNNYVTVLKHLFCQRILPFLPSSRTARKEFYHSKLVAKLLKTPDSVWPEIRDAAQDRFNFACKCVLFGLLLQIGLATTLFCFAPDKFVPYYHLQWLVLHFWMSLHLVFDWKCIRRWDRMWETSTIARELCPEHPAFNPSSSAKKFLAFTLSPTAYFDVVEDLNEGFEKHSAEFGFRYARAWYIWNAFKSLSPIVDGAIERLVKWSALAGAIECVRQFLAHK